MAKQTPARRRPVSIAVKMATQGGVSIRVPRRLAQMRRLRARPHAEFHDGGAPQAARQLVAGSFAGGRRDPRRGARLARLTRT